jgi:hypothetical protein
MCVGDEFDQVPIEDKAFWEQVAGRDMHQRAYDAMMARIAAGETVEVEHDPPSPMCYIDRLTAQEVVPSAGTAQGVVLSPEIPQQPRILDRTHETDDPVPLGNGWTLVWHADFRAFGRRWFISVERKP